MAQNIGFISTRFAGQDELSPSAKWAEVCGKTDIAFGTAGRRRDPGISFVTPEACFGFSENKWINERIWGTEKRERFVTERIQRTYRLLKVPYRFVEKFGIDILVTLKLLAIPMHVPLGLALTQFLWDYGCLRLPTIMISFGKTRFSVNCIPGI